MPAFLLPFLPALLAGLAALLVRAAARWRPRLLPAALPFGLLAGAVFLTPFNLKAVWAPRVVADHLALVALAGLVAALLPFGRRWVVVLGLAMVTGWWIAHAPPALPEFWRVGFAVTACVLLLARSGAPALCVASVAGAAALVVSGAAPAWFHALLVPAVACAAVGVGHQGRPGAAPAAAAFVVAASALAALAGGRVMSGGFGTVDAAALIPLPVAWLWPFAARYVPARSRPAMPPPKARVAVKRRRA